MDLLGQLCASRMPVILNDHRSIAEARTLRDAGFIIARGPDRPGAAPGLPSMEVLAVTKKGRAETMAIRYPGEGVQQRQPARAAIASGRWAWLRPQPASQPAGATA